MSWIIFSTVIITLLILDLGLFNKKDKVISLKESLALSLFYISIACLFGLYVYYELGAQSTHEYFTGFLLEKAMSLDNIFVISIIFSFFFVGDFMLGLVGLGEWAYFPQSNLCFQ